MAVQFSVLASGSRGNAAFLQAGAAGLLIDLGLGPRSIGHRLASVGASWDAVPAALLTHTHGDHVVDATLRFLAKRGVVLLCHEGHRPTLATFPGYRLLESRTLVRPYDDRPFLTPSGLGIEPVELRHDGGPTYGFRIQVRADRRSPSVSIGYVADTGTWWDTMADAFAEVDLLGIEFNHDVAMQRRSGRPAYLIARNLGDEGHLSNDQGSALLDAVVRRSRRGSVRDVVLLHLSEQCNRPALAVDSARRALREAGWRATVRAASQGTATSQVVERGRRGRPSPAAFNGVLS
jgi:phosphoribosyl 1,2-cyclic phosphodiesterase